MMQNLQPLEPSIFNVPCKHCDKEIYFNAGAKKWFHLDNFLTFCTGMASSGTKAEPK